MIVFHHWRHYPVGVLSIVVVFFTSISQAQINDPLGKLRLFFTAEQRARLDDARTVQKSWAPILPLPVKSKQIPQKKPEKVLPPIPEITLHGYVKRADGKNTVWLNHQAIEAASPSPWSLQVMPLEKNAREVRITMPDQSVIRLKPGQRFEPRGKKITDLQK